VCLKQLLGIGIVLCAVCEWWLSCVGDVRKVSGRSDCNTPEKTQFAVGCSWAFESATHDNTL